MKPMKDLTTHQFIIQVNIWIESNEMFVHSQWIGVYFCSIAYLITLCFDNRICNETKKQGLLVAKYVTQEFEQQIVGLNA